MMNDVICAQSVRRSFRFVAKRTSHTSHVTRHTSHVISLAFIPIAVSRPARSLEANSEKEKGNGYILISNTKNTKIQKDTLI
jgi:hypothetical protein